MSKRALVNKIIPFSLVDGPGSRCSIFLQGCNIACIYCHNPETQKSCIHCGACVESCPVKALSISDNKVAWAPDTCVACDMCIRTCEHFSTPKTRFMSTEEVFNQVKSYAPFIRGITVSGGECMLWPDFLEELFSLCKAAGLTTLIDSNGTIPFSRYPKLLERSDGVMLDVKAWGEEAWKTLTQSGVDELSYVKDNLKFLAEQNKLEELRIVVVPGYGDPELTIAGAAKALGKHNATTRLKLIRFRKYGVKGTLANEPSPDDALMESLEKKAHEAGFEMVVLT